MSALELLLPAGDFEKMQFAFAFGADAVYLGVPRYSLRARENGFKKNEMVYAAIDYAHKLNKKVYVTANILPHNHKVQPFENYVDKFLQNCQPDAWIMSDPGMIMTMREKHPEQEIHLSVQANTVNYATAKFWQKTGIKRIILSRELSIKEMGTIKEACPDLELEAFVHGSICIAYSGRCLISNYMSHRDPNQGTCSNSCRWQYKIYKKEEIQPRNLQNTATAEGFALTQHGDQYRQLKDDYYLEESERPGEFMQLDEDESGTYLMNARDLCGIEYLPELRQAGIVSFKVEGRSKSVYYAAMIARAYRRAIDDMQAGKPFDKEHLRDIFATSNKGFIAGFLAGNPGKSAQKYDGTKSEIQAYRFSGIVREFDAARKLLKIEPRNPIFAGQKLELCTSETTTEIKVQHILDDKGQMREKIHGGLYHCWIPCEKDPGKFALLREKIHEFDSETIMLSK